MIAGNRNKIKEQFKNQILSDLGGMIISKKWKKEIIDIINKHIEHGYKDTVPRLDYAVSNRAVVEVLNVFITLKNKSFNNDLSSIISKYQTQNYSSADGWAFTGISSNTAEMQDSVNTLSKESATSKDAGVKNEDAIKLAMINKGITKKKLFNKAWMYFVVIAIVGAIIIFLLMKYNKVKVSSEGIETGDVEDVDLDGLNQGE